MVDATREGTRAAVKDAVIELLVDPELRAALHRATAPPAAARPSVWARLRERARALAARARASGRSALAALTARAPIAKRAGVAAIGLGLLAWKVKKIVLVGVGVGAVVAGPAYLGGHHLAAVLSGLGAAATTVAVRAGLWVRSTVGRLSLT